MATQNVAELIVARFHVVYSKQGFTEKYYINEDNYTDGKTKALEILDARADCLCKDAFIEWASISKLTETRDSKAIMSLAYREGHLLDAETAGNKGTCNNPEAAMQFRFETEDGKWANRNLRCVRDSWIANDWYASPVTAIAGLKADAYATSEDGMTSNDALGNWIKAVLKNVVIVRPSGDNDFPYQVRDFDVFNFRGIGSRDIGLPFGASRGRAPSDK